MSFHGNICQRVNKAFDDLTKILSFHDQRSQGFRNLLNSMKDRLSPYLSEQRVKILHNLMMFFTVKSIETKTKTTVYANSGLHLRKCNCIKHRALFLSNTFQTLGNMKYGTN